MPIARPMIQARTYVNPAKAIHLPPFNMAPVCLSGCVTVLLIVIVSAPFQCGLQCRFPPGLLSPKEHQRGIDQDDCSKYYCQERMSGGSQCNGSQPQDDQSEHKGYQSGKMHRRVGGYQCPPD